MKYAPSILLGRLSRSAGSTTAGHNRFGAYLRNRVIPTNPATEAQSLVRGSLSTWSQAWRELTQEQRNGWTAFGESMVRTDSLGQTYTLTGLQAYISVNRNLDTTSSTALSDAPLYSPPPSLLTGDLTATVGTDAMSLAYTATPLATGHKLVVMATRQLSAGINFQQRGAYKLVHVSAAAAASPANILAEYEALFGQLVIGNKILAKAYVIDTATGLASSPPLELSTIVAAGA